MSQYNFNSCLKTLEEDNYAEFKDYFEQGVSGEEADVLLRASIMHQKKFFVEYLLKNAEFDEPELKSCQALAASAEELSILKMLIKDGAVESQTWMNLFNIHSKEVLKEFLETCQKPVENLTLIIQYALANKDPGVHELAFDRFFKPDLLDTEEKKNNLIDSIAFSGNMDLLDKIEGLGDLKSQLSAKQAKHEKFAVMLDEYIEMIFQLTPKEKVASTVNSLNLMEEIRENPQVEDWDIIIQDYLVNEDTSIVSLKEGELSENCLKMLELVKSNNLALLEVSEIKPKDYLIRAKNILDSSRELKLVLDRRIYDPRVLYLCYISELDDDLYISSHPLFILPDRKSLIQLGLRKEKDRKQQKAGKKTKGRKGGSAKISLTSSEKYKYLLTEHIRSRKEIDDSV